MRFPSPYLGIISRPPEALASTKTIAVIVLSSVVYQAILAFIHTHFFQVSAFVVAATELMIYLACVAVLAQRIRLEFVTLVALVLAYLLVLSLFRNALELKGFRDVMIPILFYGLGRQVVSTVFADRLLKIFVSVVLLFGFFELFFLDQYSRLLNIFSYYMGTGTVTLSSNYISDSALNLNGIRPEGIGRTVLPALLGSHRVSSVFLEPVSLGNFAVIVAAWGLAKPRAEFRQGLFFVLSAITLIALSDSRYGLILVSLLSVMRLALSGRVQIALITLPFISILGVLLIGLFFQGGLADNIMGRLFWTGDTLLGFNMGKIMGVDGFDIPYGDMGYAYLFSRWGVLLCLVLWGALWMIRMPDERGNRFRAYSAFHIALILTVSGTSFFALKTAGLLWFLMGICARGQEQQAALPKPDKAPALAGREVSYAN